MPGFTTHYLFGLTAYKELSNPTLKKIIFDNHAAFSLGLQGPDIFFYYLPSYAMHDNNIGSVAHIEETNKFFRNLLESRNLFSNQQDTRIAYSYILGFLGHYLLDCNCHPYVYHRTHYSEKTPDYHGAHMNLETDIDTELLFLYKQMLPSHFHQQATIKLSKRQHRTIAAMLYYVYSMTYPDLKLSRSSMRLAIRYMQLGTRLLHDSHGKKKVLIRKIESFTTGFPILSPMISSDYLQFFQDPLNMRHKIWCNPWQASMTSTASFLDLWTDAKVEYLEVLHLLKHLFDAPQSSKASADHLFAILNRLGNNSYHSGLSLNE